MSITEGPAWAFLGWDAVMEADYPAYRAGDRSRAANASSCAAITSILDSGGNQQPKSPLARGS